MPDNAMTAEQIVQYNAYARGRILREAVDTWQQIFTVNRDPSTGNVFNVPFKNVGLIKGFLVQITGTIRNTDAAKTATLTELGAANFLQQIIVSDFSNTTRIQTAGWHVHLINSAKQALVFGGAYSPNIPVKYGNNWTVQSAAATIAPTTDAAVSFFYYIPCAYSKDDLRGAIFASIVNSTASLTLTLNTAIMTDAGADATLAAYGGSVGGWKASTNVTITVYQNYLDQLPRDANGQYVLPPMDMNTIYELKNTAYGTPVVGQDFGIQFANYRTFLSCIAIYNNAGVLNVGSDINSFALQAANTTQIFKYTPAVAALLARSTFYADPPKGVYYFDFRARPINTQQFGNMQLSINPSAVTTGASILVGFEDFSSVSQVQNASSLPTAA